MTKQCLFRFTPEHIHLIVTNTKDGGDSAVQVWGQLRADFVFSDYRVESANNNEIWLDVSCENMVRALKSSTQSVNGAGAPPSVVMKLTKKDNLPILSLVITALTRTGKGISLVQDVPVHVLNKAESDAFKEPMVPEPQVHIMMPPLANVKVIMDRMKSMSNFITVAANMSGDFVMKVKAQEVQLETTFTDLVNPELDPTQVDVSKYPSMHRDPAEFAEARVHVRDFGKFVHSYAVNPTNVVCCIIEKHGLVFYLYIGEDNSDQSLGTLTYYIPIRAS
ncbi:checkpoint protein Hus1/Mec3 [Cladochytrium replicatum]|nr:checkpoint protein Hus1/Mec3 [Cladochytrium replicatum]